MHIFRMMIRGCPPGLAAAMLFGVHAIFGAASAIAAESASARRFQLSGSATLTLDQPAQSDGIMRLKAYLTPKDAAIAVLPPVQEGGGFAMIARATSSVSVCYNDTIFRDDFDGDGG